MAKQLRSEMIYIAPSIKGRINENGEYEVIDEKTGYTLNPRLIDDKILIFERQVKEWFLNRASRLQRGKNNGFIILMIGLSYIEGIEECKSGVSSLHKSKIYFKRGISRIFSISEDSTNLDDFYDQVRCGLFHSGMTRKKVIINSTFDDPVDFSESDTIKINPKKFIHEIRLDFNRYIKKLKNKKNIDERHKFDRIFSNI